MSKQDRLIIIRKDQLTLLKKSFKNRIKMIDLELKEINEELNKCE